MLKSAKKIDRQVQQAKRIHWFQTQTDLLDELDEDSNEFWKTIGKIGISNCQNKKIPMEVISGDGQILNDTNAVLEHWKSEFSALYNRPRDHSLANDVNVGQPQNHPENGINEYISIFEVKKAVTEAKRNKASGLDGIPADVLKNDRAISFLHVLFNVCFEKGCIPSDWGKGIINPIPKSSTMDPRDPLSYRGITLASAMYKIYCAVLNKRLSKWVENNGILVDEQNGFRKGRSTVDHISSLSNLINTRKKAKLSTYCAFVDFKKAYDYVDRDIMWGRLESYGLDGKMFSAIKSLYHSVSACVRLNGICSQWFDIQTGLRQGCSLSPILFNLYINDLASKVKALGEGVDIGDEKVCIMLYADDIVLLSDNEKGLQNMLDVLSLWCKANEMCVNNQKSNVVHFRLPSVDRTHVNFYCGDGAISVVNKYTYLGILLDEFLDYNVTAKVVVQSASRALGLLVAKTKCLEGLPFQVFTKLYDSVVWPVIAYGAAVWGDRSFSCINAVQNRAIRFFLGTGKYTPTAAVSGDMGWQPPVMRQWKATCLQWFRFLNMGTLRVNKRIFDWCNIKARSNCKNWCFLVKKKFEDLWLNRLANNDGRLAKKMYVDAVQDALSKTEESTWLNAIDKEQAVNGSGRNKLRTYRLIKRTYKTEQYCLTRLPPKHRSAFAKVRCGVAPIRIETGRYEGLELKNRICPVCKNDIEDEVHVILHCPVYSDLRKTLFDKAAQINTNFLNMGTIDKFIFLFTNAEMIKLCAKTCFQILQKRHDILYI